VLLGITVTSRGLVSRGITRPLGRLRQSMTALADGNLTASLAVARDAMKWAHGPCSVVFQQHNGERNAPPPSKQRSVTGRAREAGGAGSAGDTIEQETSQALQQISATTTMMTTQRIDEQRATRTGTRRRMRRPRRARRSRRTTVASAAEQLSVSIREIGGQVGQSSAVVAAAVEAAGRHAQAIGR